MWMEVKVFIRNVIYTLYVKLYVKDPMWLVSVSNEPSKSVQLKKAGFKKIK